jgi:hypothetical protein
VTCERCDQTGGPLVECAVCGMRKAPFGRSASPYDGGYCGWDCDGYTQEPRPGSLWPGERWGDSMPCIHGDRGKEGKP